ncbi:hypothetical protein [Negativicoccus succinicivorans]|uniref:hypothetical protein n=1 Tax=Negativicoccus succinicivorans TaxID=620903 RepID=UPI0028FDD26B|nr:hypothetical protein [Negativicoccus succinicivorans]MDU2417614.1 hypothetical protein [Negativicoccus succinicivorans]
MRKLPVLTLGLTFAVAAAFAQAGPSHHKLLPPLPPLPPQHAEAYAPVVVVAPEAIAMPSADATVVQADNQIRWVMAVDFMTVEVRMAKPLSAEMTQPDAVALAQQNFHISDNVKIISAPLPVPGEDKLYRLRVDGFAPATLYRIRYQDAAEQTFRTYRNDREMSEHYKNRYGDFF